MSNSGSLVVVPPAADETAARQSPRHESTGRREVQRLVDFNVILPDGTPGSLHQLLLAIAEATGAVVYAGIHNNYGWILSSSNPPNHRGEQLTPAMRGAVEEAAMEIQSCLIANADRQTSMLLQSVRLESAAEQVVSLGIESGSAKVGLVLLFDTSSTVTTELLVNQIKQIRCELPSWFELWFLSFNGRKRFSWDVRFQRLYSQRKTWLLAACILTTSMAIPIPYWPQRQCIVEPESRRFLTSPVEGRVVDAQVRPGDVVQPNQLLARIDDESIRWELANAQADFQMACKKRDTALASRSGGDLRMAQLESEQAAIQIESLQSKLQQLEIRSPIAGVVVDGDWVRNSGTSVERSQTLFEIAPLDSMRIRTLLSTEDLGQISNGTPVSVYVDSAYGMKWTGTIERIDPRGRVENSDVVFEAETVVNNPDQTLQPGMRGSARLTSGWRSLGWMIFHRPYTWLMKKLAW